MRVVALIPAYNEEKTIAKVVLESLEYCQEVVVCDDGSTDSTGRIATAVGATVIRHRDNEHKGEAVRSLFLKALEYDADAFVTLDADGQHDPRDIPRLLKGLESADIAIGRRTGIPTSRAVGNLFLSGFSDVDTQSGFRAYRADVLPMLVPSETGMAVDSEILEEAQRLNLRVRQVQVSVDYGVPNPSKTNMVMHFLDVLLTRFKLATFRHPLVLYGVPGLAFIAVSLAFGFKSLSLAELGISAFPIAVAQGLVAVYLMLVGLASCTMALTIWTVVSMTRRMQR